MILALYNLLWQLARPLLLRKLRRRGQAEPLYLHAVHQRFARYTDQERQQAQTHAGQWVWLHAVSLGETRAADILLQALRAVQPGMRLLLTHGTATGREAGKGRAQMPGRRLGRPTIDMGYRRKRRVHQDDAGAQARVQMIVDLRGVETGDRAPREKVAQKVGAGVGEFVQHEVSARDFREDRQKPGPGRWL